MNLRKRLQQIEEQLDKLNPKNDSTQMLLLICEAIELDRILAVQDAISEDMLEFLIKEGVIDIKYKDKITIKWDELDPEKIGVGY